MMIPPPLAKQHLLAIVNPELPHKCMKDFDREFIFEVLNIYN